VVKSHLGTCTLRLTDGTRRIPGGEQRPSNTPEDGPSSTTAHELKALEAFRERGSHFTPVLVNFKKVAQPGNGALPGGFITFMIMSKMPGDSLFNLYYWGMAPEEQADIKHRFLEALR
jgi:hypothetical protein